MRRNTTTGFDVQSTFYGQLATVLAFAVARDPRASDGAPRARISERARRIRERGALCDRGVNSAGMSSSCDVDLVGSPWVPSGHSRASQIGLVVARALWWGYLDRTSNLSIIREVTGVPLSPDPAHSVSLCPGRRVTERATRDSAERSKMLRDPIVGTELGRIWAR